MFDANSTELFLTIPELCARWKIEPQVLKRIRLHGLPPLHVKFGKQIRYPIAEVLAAEAIHPGRR
jgi:hypothetical protein